MLEDWREEVRVSNRNALVDTVEARDTHRSFGSLFLLLLSYVSFCFFFVFFFCILYSVSVSLFLFPFLFPSLFPSTNFDPPIREREDGV